MKSCIDREEQERLHRMGFTFENNLTKQEKHLDQQNEEMHEIYRYYFN